MILGFHLILTAYGFWLPNDPRGSWSDFVREWELLRFGKATKVSTTRSVAHVPHDRKLRLQAREALRYAPVHFTGAQCLIITRGFREVVNHWGLSIHACSVLPEHTHLVIGRTCRHIRQVMGQLKGRASQHLAEAGLHPFQDAFDRWGRISCWARHGWHVFIDDPQHMRSAIRYVVQNPLKEGKRVQSWRFVTPWDGGLHVAPRATAK